MKRTTILALALAGLLAGCTERACVTPQNFEDAAAPCDNNGGVAVITFEEPWHYRSSTRAKVFCNNGAVFRINFKAKRLLQE